MGSRNPDFADKVSRALEAADDLIVHLDLCTDCMVSTSICKPGNAKMQDYHAKRAAALKTIRKAGKK